MIAMPHLIENLTKNRKAAKELGRAYADGPGVCLTDHKRDRLALFIQKLFHETFSPGLAPAVCFVDEEPYQDYEAMSEVMSSTGVLYIWNGYPETPAMSAGTNLLFRAIHDYHHIQLAAPFSLEGEARTAHHIAGMTDDDLFKQVFQSEILLRSAHYIAYGVHPLDYRVVLLPVCDMEGLYQCLELAV